MIDIITHHSIYQTTTHSMINHPHLLDNLPAPLWHRFQQLVQLWVENFRFCSIFHVNDDHQPLSFMWMMIIKLYFSFDLKKWCKNVNNALKQISHYPQPSLPAWIPSPSWPSQVPRLILTNPDPNQTNHRLTVVNEERENVSEKPELFDPKLAFHSQSQF